MSTIRVRSGRASISYVAMAALACLVSCSSGGRDASDAERTSVAGAVRTAASSSPLTTATTATTTTAIAAVAATKTAPSSSSGSESTSTQPSGSPPRGPVPEPLQTIEAGAEDIIDLVPDSSWGRIVDDVDAMKSTWSTFHDNAVTADAALADRVDAAIDALSTAARSKNGPATSQAANDVSGPIVELFAHYDFPRPIQIGRLDVIGRQIILDSDRSDVAAAGAQIATARTEWSVLRGSVVAHNGDDVASKAEATLDALDRAARAGDRATLAKKATELLELVDAMEGLY
jgi:hypothetical protein